MDRGPFPNFANTEQATEYVCDHFRWSLKDPLNPGPKPLPTDYHGLCPRLDLEVLAIFYAMVIDDAAELGLSHRLTMDVVMWAMQKLDWGLVEAWLGDNDQRLRRAQAAHSRDSPANLVLESNPSRERTSSFPSFRDTVQAVEYMQNNLRWTKRETLSLRSNLLPQNFSVYWPEFNHIFAHATHISQMVQAIYYAMVINDAARLRLIRRETGESLMSDLRKLRWAVIEAWLLSIRDELKNTRR
ncbi:hypothetical protein Cgig2_033824 [Carnegiea gigantea]|uniref:Uncharacterized protein n=1 Tax=Carnegiea gigantea TaxID=171969 RepID=A0A9Q1JTH1_9CARY|nr:hypothetical protein Cgig2_033824 [Carnegiea gigantea]